MQLVASLTLIDIGVVFALDRAAADLPPSDRAALLQVAAELRTAIQHGDATTVLRFVSRAKGLECTDTTYRIKEVERDLRDTHSYLYMGLFDSPGFSARCGDAYPRDYPASSDKAFFEHSPASAIEVIWVAKDYAEVTYASEVGNFYPRKYSFHKEGSSWKLVGGFIIGDCSCG